MVGAPVQGGHPNGGGRPVVSGRPVVVWCLESGWRPSSGRAHWK